MAGVMVTDELQELEKRLARLEAEVAAMRSGRDEADRQLAQAAERIESLSRRLSPARRDR
jgi:cell division protein ZapA (FtsZ GTPase activity inhibitor)